uniref:Chondroitin proteoglycan 4 domain-containing protein n=1 Tax=Panagrolaimus sp. JU765 TaxID=591449 RepID=A0AC34QVQ7_9BILA
MKISFFVLIFFIICPGFCANITTVNFETILKALGLSRSVRICVDPFINVLHDSFETESPINDLPIICNSYNNTKKCFREHNAASDVKIFNIATSGVNNLCTQKWPFLEKNWECLVKHSGYKAKACDAKCNMLQSLADLSHDQQVAFWAESGGNIIKMLTKLGDICSAARCFLPCYRDQLNQSCKRAGGMIVDGLLKPFYQLANFVKNSGPLVQQFLAVNMPPTCRFLTNETLLKNIRKGESD